MISRLRSRRRELSPKCHQIGCTNDVFLPYNWYCSTCCFKHQGIQIVTNEIVLGYGVIATMLLRVGRMFFYEGEKRRIIRNDNLDYAVEVDGGFVIDARDPLKANFTRFVNHAHPPNKPNCEFVGFSPDFNRVGVMITRQVNPDEELLLDYGIVYWSAQRADMLERSSRRYRRSRNLQVIPPLTWRRQGRRLFRSS